MTGKPEVEMQTSKICCLRGVDRVTEFLLKFPGQRFELGFSRLDRTAEAPSMSGNENIGLYVAQLHQVSTVIDGQYGRHRVARNQSRARV